MTGGAERLFLPDTRTPRPGGEFVLYWMQATHRADWNLALEFAIEEANALRLPVLVYHGLRHDYPWASDRLHTFILEGVIDLYAGFEARGIQYAFYLDERAGTGAEWPAGTISSSRAQRRIGAPQSGSDAPRSLAALGMTARSPLVQLADRAALVVTDFNPTFIYPRQIKALRRKTETPVIAVDACGVVPLKAVSREHSTARGIRTELMAALPHHLWPIAGGEPRVRRAIDLPFERARPTRDGLAALVARCDIDHAVPPSPAFRGGAVAARAQLRRFLEVGLHRYADERNDPNEPDATSRLSPWLHFGHISAQEVLLAARDAGPAVQYEKFLDETLVWRELSHNFCFHNPRHRTTDGLPTWAREQLAAHEADPRPALYPDDDLEHARTDSELWNAAQRAYLRDGFMHNYLRMLWAKAVLAWTPNAAECLRILEHLNNKYALDGRDPNSYGGIMWTFGKFDRPFYRRPIYGTVRYQSLKAAADKFDVPRYVRRYGPA
jgi:deoxyribodipyrimidine photo-lyase